MYKREGRLDKLLNLKETINTERHYRIKFYLENPEKFGGQKESPKRRESYPESKTSSVNCQAWEDILKKKEQELLKEIETAEMMKYKSKNVGEMNKEDKPCVECQNMRPSSPATKSTIYSGLCKEGFGRCLYLKKRAVKSPKEKYVYPMVSSWEYGWDQPDLPTMIRDSNSRKGRKNLIEKALYSNNGITFELLDNAE